MKIKNEDLKYIAPELIIDINQDISKADVYSFGIIL